MRNNSKSRVPAVVGGAVLALSLALTGCAGGGGSAAPADKAPEIGISDTDYSLEKLIEAAKQEGPITVVDATGKIVEMAEGFTAEYGIQATGVKMAVKDQQEVLTREHQASNVKTDVYSMGDIPTVQAQLIPEGLVVSWMPPDLKDDVPAALQEPVVSVMNPLVWVYNTEKYGDTCPVDNMWALTDPEWKGKVAIEDPLLLTELDFWFNQMKTHNDAALRDAYQAHYGKALETNEASATHAWVKAFAENAPQITKSDTEATVAVGAAGQADPPVGFVSSGKFRENDASGYKLGLCHGLKPWSGHLSPKVAIIASGTKSPNASKLFVHWMLTQKGIQPQLDDGKLSTNTKVTPAADDPSGVINYINEMHVSDSSTAADDLESLVDWQDFWRSVHK